MCGVRKIPEFKPSCLYAVSSRRARTSQRDPVLKKQVFARMWKHAYYPSTWEVVTSELKVQVILGHIVSSKPTPNLRVSRLLKNNKDRWQNAGLTSVLVWFWCCPEVKMPQRRKE